MMYPQRLDSLAQTAAGHELSYDADAVRRLDPEVRARAEAELVRRVEVGDVLAFETVAKLGLTAAGPALERQRDHGSRWHRSTAARALFLLRGDAMPATGDPLSRGLNAWALRSSDRPETIPALLALLNDTSLHARVHASEGLLQKLGLEPLAAPRGSPLRRVALAISSELPSLWPLGAAELNYVLGAVYGKASPDALDLRYRTSADPASMARFWDEATGGKAFSIANLVGMDEHDRSFAETVLVARLVDGDLHALRALWALDVTGWGQHVRTAIPFIAAQPVARKAYEDALVAAPEQP